MSCSVSFFYCYAIEIFIKKLITKGQDFSNHIYENTNSDFKFLQYYILEENFICVAA